MRKYRLARLYLGNTNRNYNRKPLAGHVKSFDIEADVISGIEQFAADDLMSLHGAPLEDLAIGLGTLTFHCQGRLNWLLAARCVNSVYVVKDFKIRRPHELLAQSLNFNTLVAALEYVVMLHPARTFKNFYLSAAGDMSPVMRRLKTKISETLKLPIGDESGDLLIRLRRSRTDFGWQVLIRLTPRPLSTRPWRACNMPGALNATLAYAMARIVPPKSTDNVLNVASGSGTLLIERALICRAKRLVACDISHDAIACSVRNCDAAGLENRVAHIVADAVRLPLQDSTFDIIFSDLPFGKLVGSHKVNETLYPALLKETARVAESGASLLLITHDIKLLERALFDAASLWKTKNVFRVNLGPQHPRIYHVIRTSWRP